MANAARQQNCGQPLRLLASGLRLAVVCILPLLNPAATSLAASPPPSLSVNLSWDTSTSTNVAGYNIYYGTTSGNYTQIMLAGQVTQKTITGLTPATTYFFAATSYDDTGLESTFSNETSLTVPAPQPELSLVRTGTKSALQWPTNFPGYTLQWSSSLTGEWTDLTSSPSNSGSYFTYEDATSAARQFYRLKK